MTESMGKFEYDACVKFYAEKSKADNCLCTGCHNIGQVMKLSLPETLYREPKYNKLETQYSTYWFCKDCLRKLLYTISDAERRAEKGGSRMKLLKVLWFRHKHRQFCKLNGYYCPDCIYHNFVWDGIIFRGNQCLFGRKKKDAEPKSYENT